MSSNLRFLLLIIIIIVGFVIATNINNNSINYSTNVKRLVSVAEKADAKASIDLYYSLDDSEKNAFIKYFNDNAEKVPPVWFFVVADQVFKSDRDKAVLYIMIGKLRVTQDVYLCEDTTARNGQPSAYFQAAPNTINYMGSKLNDNKYAVKIMEKSLDWDKTHNRYNPIWACGHGLKFLYTGEEPRLINEYEFDKVRDSIRQQVQEAINKRK